MRILPPQKEVAVVFDEHEASILFDLLSNISGTGPVRDFCDQLFDVVAPIASETEQKFFRIEDKCIAAVP